MYRLSSHELQWGYCEQLFHGHCGRLLSICYAIFYLHSYLLLATLLHIAATECDRMFVSNRDGNRNGSFAAPNFTLPEGQSRQCIYTFIAREDERVQLKFFAFNLRGSPPDGSIPGQQLECNHEYLDLYSEVEDTDTDLINTPFGGRYCGALPPRLRISRYRTFVLGFYSDLESIDETQFQGSYEFINASKYTIGTLEPNTACSFVIHSDKTREGDLYSPTYPGAYPKDMRCTYAFHGNKGQRIRVEFMDFDLFFGGSHCPFDYVRAYDGPDIRAPQIGTFCGQQRSRIIYSSTEHLFIEFLTLMREADTQNRGFSGNFEFSERYVNLGFISKMDGEHLRGTECDQRILSKHESNGSVYSPNYPFLYHSSTMCKYYIYGLEDKQNLERVKLEFDKFEIPSNDPHCADGYLKIFVKGQEEMQQLDKPDFTLCGRIQPPVIISEGPRLFMMFSSGTTQGQGFKARYTFETEYMIPGTAAPDGSCNFTYVSEGRYKSGEFNSPRHPAHYPSNTTCQFHVIGLRGELVMVVFDHFAVKTLSDEHTGSACQNDWVEVYNVYYDGTERPLGRYCGSIAPGPVITDYNTHHIKVVFTTDAQDVLSGFKAKYSFLPGKPMVGDCGTNYSSMAGGSFVSPNHPEKYDVSNYCNWFISAKQGHKILVHFVTFVVEGSHADRGCPAAVVRYWKSLNSLPFEMCGVLDEQQIISDDNAMRIAFISADKATREKGFKAVWTEIKDGPGCDIFGNFHCKVNGFCISRTLLCNDQPNCGIGDNSDEENCIIADGWNIYLIAGLGSGGFLLMFLLVCVYCHHRRHLSRRKRQRHSNMSFPAPPPPAPFAAGYGGGVTYSGASACARHPAGDGGMGSLQRPKYMSDNSAARFSSVDSV